MSDLYTPTNFGLGPGIDNRGLNISQYTCLVAAAAQPLVAAAEVDAVDPGLVRASPQLHQLHPLGRVPDPDQGPL